MKRKYTRVISALLAVLLISTQPAVMTWADSMVPADHLLDGDEYIGKKTGYATPADAEQKDEEALKPDAAPEQEKIPPSRIELEDEKQMKNKNPDKTVIQWDFVDDDNLSGGELFLIGVSPENRVDFDTVVSMLPKKVLAKVWAEMDGAAHDSREIISDDIEDIPDSMIGESYEETIPITAWSCPEYREDEDGELPFTGEYEFIAELPEGYVCEPPISVLVTLGGAMVNTINDRFTVDGLKYKELGPDTVQLMGYDGAKPVGTPVIPDKVRKPSNGREYQVVSIGHEAFLYCSGLTGDLVIPDTVTEIGSNAFRGCHFTGELTLSNSLTTIGAGAFYDCGFTGQLALPQTLIRIEGMAFGNTTFSGQLILPEKLNYIGGAAFYDCSFTGELIIPDEVSNIGISAFLGNRFTGDLNIPDTVTDIGASAFSQCEFTGELILPDGLTSIGSDAFRECSNFTGRLRIPDGITSIGSGAFKDTGFDGFDTTKWEIADLLHDSGVAEDKIMVGNQSYLPSPPPSVSFFQDGNMVYQIIGSDTVKLTSYNGNSDTDIIIPDTVTDRLSGTTYSVTHIGSAAFFRKAITGSLHLPNTLVSIGESAFAENSFTGDLTIPENVSHIGFYAFKSSGFTGNLTIECKLTYLGSFIFNDCRFTGVLSLPDTLTAIGEHAFSFCDFTGSLQLPAGLTSIGDYSFFNCSGFTGTLYLPKPITEIGEMAFSGCDGLDSAHLGPNLQKLGIQAFPESLPLSTDSPRVQLLINTYLNQNAIADTSWDGMEDVPDGAVATVKQDTTVTGDRRIGTEVVITVPSGVILTVDGKLTVDGNLVVNGTIFVEGTLIINGSLSGSGTLIIGKNGRVEGDVSGCRVEYQEDREDIEAAKKMVESQTYTLEQEAAGNEAAVRDWLLKTISVIPGLSDTGVTLGEMKVTAFKPAIEGTSDRPEGVDGSFAFTMPLIKGNSESSAGGAGTITAKGYSHIPGQEEWKDIEDAKNMVEGQIYAIEQENAGDEAALKEWLLKTIAAIPGFGDKGVTVGELKITSFTPATEGTSDQPNGVDGSFVFTLMLSKGNREGGAGGAGTIRAKGYSYIPGGRPSGSNDGEDYGSNAVNPEILRGTWERTETGIWKFRQTSGAYAVSRWGMVDGLWYYFDGEGRMLTGWQYINHQWYYLCTVEDTKIKINLKEGAMATGWHFDSAYQAWFYLGTDGAMAVGQREIDGKRYYFNPESDGTKGALQKEEEIL